MKLVKPCKKVTTFDRNKKVNGWLLEVVSKKDGFTEHIKGQVYLTVASPGALKGFHVHKHKIDHFTCVKGNIILIVWNGKKFLEYDMGEKNFVTVKVPPKMPHAIYNYGKEDAYVINYCYPPYDSKDPDQVEWEEVEWKPKMKSEKNNKTHRKIL